MKVEIWIIIIIGFVIIYLFFANRNKVHQIEQLTEAQKRERDNLHNEILNLKTEIERGNIATEDACSTSKGITKELRAEIIKQSNNAKSKYEALYQKYCQLMRTYMLARKKSEIDVLNEIEKSISDDYESLGSQNIPVTSYIASAMADFYTSQIKTAEEQLIWLRQQSRSERIADVRKDAASLIARAKTCQYTMEAVLTRILKEYPLIKTDYIQKHYGISLDDAVNGKKYSEDDVTEYINEIRSLKAKCARLEQKNKSFRENEDIKDRVNTYINEIHSLKSKCAYLEQKIKSFNEYKDKRWTLLKESITDYQKQFSSNLTAIPYMSRIIADIMTVDIDRLAWSLSWGNNQERKKKVASLNALKKEKSDEIARLKGAEYQLAYLLELYPVLQDVIETDFNDLEVQYEQIVDFDPVRHFLDQVEWEKLSETERNQLALDRYVESRKKSKWQVGRDFELYCGYCYEKKGYEVEYFGSYNRLEDLGRDLIIKRDSNTWIVQCKYWSKSKKIHENHVMQLFGSVMEYNIKNKQNATGILITNTVLSETAKEFANALKIMFIEDMPLCEFPRIKCNIGVGESGEKTKIYHLPFDQQYDVTKIEKDGEFMALTVAEAEEAGFRRAYRWHGNQLSLFSVPE